MFQLLFRVQADEKQESLETIMDKGYDQIKIIIQHNQWSKCYIKGISH